ncbi:hypothetical protein LCGC14_0326360 [marine sediment metagenome]|uniref:Uncharacterized protein n=1 Tax=marine sediment metagenome TaxID=412755 RepID=A0A0F9TNI1_9ZZZZ
MVSLVDIQGALIEKHSGLGLSEVHIEFICTPPVDSQKTSCWFDFLMKLFETGDLYESVKSLLRCLMETQLISQADAKKCLMDFAWSWLTGTPLSQALMALVMCLLSQPPQPPPPPPPPSGEIPDFAGREVKRCGN